MSPLPPMLASLGEAPLASPNFVYEPKYDGIRAIAEIGARGRGVRLWSRLGNEKTSQFPEVAAALAAWAKRFKDPIVVDGELVALDAHGEPVGFQHLQGRIHVKDDPAGARRASDAPDRVAFIAFDLLIAKGEELCDTPLLDRRRALEQLFKGKHPASIRISDQVRGDGRALYAQAVEHGWEGLIAKQAQSKYRPGKRSPDWVKLKILHEQEFVVAGWTEPRQSRVYFGALLLGVYEGEKLVYVGHTGTGFDTKELARVMAKLKPLETRESPFAVRPRTNERPHWVRPELVAQVKFTEWTSDGILRHPVYLGLRDDKRPGDVVHEGAGRLHGSSSRRLTANASTDTAAAARRPQETRRAKRAAIGTAATRTAAPRTTAPRTAAPRTAATQPAASPPPALTSLIENLRELEDARRDGTLELPGGHQLGVTNLHKVFWPDLKATKGDLFRYYVEVSPFILPVLADRALVMKRFPNGIDAKPFYQHRVEKTPPDVRVEAIPGTDGRPQLVGGDLITLLYTCQLAAISQDPWFSRVRSARYADHVAIDLDPADTVPFDRVLDVARWVHDELDSLGIVGLPKTSGASGLHIYIPLAPRTPYEAGLLFCQLVATMVAEKHPKVATVERAVKKRGSRVYVDYLQNIEGKTLASAYSARASRYGGVSTPLSWEEVDAGVRREDFTIRTTADRLRKVGDLWAPLRSSPGADLHELVNRNQRRRGR